MEPEKSLTDWLVRYHESLLAGEPDRLPSTEEVPASERKQAETLAAVIGLLEETWAVAEPSTLAYQDGSNGKDASSEGPPLTEGSPSEVLPPTVSAVPGTNLDLTIRPSSFGVPTIPGFEVLAELGRGSMGIVYRARQLNMDRDVALKVLPPAFSSDPDRVARFRIEARAAGQLAHANILPVHNILEAGGTLVLVMMLVQGRDLGRIILDRREVLEGKETVGRHPWAFLDDREYLEALLPLLDQLVDALACVHEKKVDGRTMVHRDVKPTNVLVDHREGRAYLTDFGLARLTDNADLTEANMVLGTRGFMSPEQASKIKEVDGRADVFSLGATFYQALTLELPFGKEAVTPKSPPPKEPSQCGRSVPRDLDSVILKALEPDRERRYASSADFRDDWRLVRSGRDPKWARRIGPWGRLVRRVRRHPWGLADAALLLLLIGFLGSRIVVILTPLPGEWVKIETEIPGARVVCMPLDEGGEPNPSEARRPRALTPATLRLRPGAYLIEAQLPDGRFAEVYRTVPSPDKKNELTYQLRSLYSGREADGTIIFRPIHFGGASATTEMAACPYSATFPMKNGLVGPTDQSTTRDVTVEPFDMDDAEVTMGDFLRVVKGPPGAFPVKEDPAPELPVRYVSFDEALEYAELRGVRLPSKDEFDFHATNAGTTTFPWGNTPPAPPWYFGPVDGPGLGLSQDFGIGVQPWFFRPLRETNPDRTLGSPPVFGLYSNALEWTSSGYGRPLPPKEVQKGQTKVFPRPPGASDSRVVLGGPLGVLDGTTDDPAIRSAPTPNATYSRDAAFPRLGFRCAKSKAPRYLNDPKVAN